MPFKPSITNTMGEAPINVLASEHFQFVEGGATFDKASLTKELPTGQAVAKNAAGKWIPYVDLGDEAASYADLGVTNHEVEASDVDIIVGEVIVVGSVYEAKLTGVTPKFKEAAKQLRFVSHV